MGVFCSAWPGRSLYLPLGGLLIGMVPTVLPVSYGLPGPPSAPWRGVSGALKIGLAWASPPACVCRFLTGSPAVRRIADSGPESFPEAGGFDLKNGLHSVRFP